jgi:hypothetical protein
MVNVVNTVPPAASSTHRTRQKQVPSQQLCRPSLAPFPVFSFGIRDLNRALIANKQQAASSVSSVAERCRTLHGRKAGREQREQKGRRGARKRARGKQWCGSRAVAASRQSQQSTRPRQSTVHHPATRPPGSRPQRTRGQKARRATSERECALAHNDASGGSRIRPVNRTRASGERIL